MVTPPMVTFTGRIGVGNGAAAGLPSTPAGDVCPSPVAYSEMMLPIGAGVDDAPGRLCLDWTERRPHLGGPLGVALFSRLTELRWIVANPATRAVRVTHAGAVALEQQLGIAVPR